MDSLPLFLMPLLLLTVCFYPVFVMVQVELEVQIHKTPINRCSRATAGKYERIYFVAYRWRKPPGTGCPECEGGLYAQTRALMRAGISAVPDGVCGR